VCPFVCVRASSHVYLTTLYLKCIAKTGKPRTVGEKFRLPQAVGDRLCGLVVRVPGYRSRGPGSILGSTRLSDGLERGPLSLVSTIE
jgi:hypothetical protein